MKPAPFEYYAPTSLEEALDLMHRNGAEAKLLAGGQSLIPVMNFRLAQPTMIVDLNRVDELARINAPDAGGLRVGAMVRQSTLEHNGLVAGHAPLVREAMPHVAHSQIRNRGTLGGSLAHADPAAELPAVMVALQAQLHLRRSGHERRVDAEDFFVSLFTTALEPEEILVEVDIPSWPRGGGFAFLELARRHGDYAQAGVVAVVELDQDGVCRRARLVFLSVGEVPMLARQAAAMLVGHRLSPDLIAEVSAHAARHEIAPVGDIHATADYKRHLARVLGQRALAQACARAEASWNQ